jgi:hypothetical protein
MLRADCKARPAHFHFPVDAHVSIKQDSFQFTKAAQQDRMTYDTIKLLLTKPNL